MDAFHKNFGLSPSEFAANLRDNKKSHQVQHCVSHPLKLLEPYMPVANPSVKHDLLNGACFMLAAEIAVEPYVIKCTREYFFKSASLSVSPTKRGFSLIKEGHPLYPFKFVKNKPVFSFEKDQFAVLILGALNNLVTINFPSGTVGAFTSNFAQKLELFQTGGSRGEHKIWNSLLNRVFDIALNEVIVPMLIEELKSKLLKEALEYVCKTSCQQLRNWLKV